MFCVGWRDVGREWQIYFFGGRKGTGGAGQEGGCDTSGAKEATYADH